MHRLSATDTLVQARRALSDGLGRVRPNAARDSHGDTTRLEDNLLIGIGRAQLEDSFGRGAGHELDRKIRAPWSSSALAVNSFAPWQTDPSHLSLAGLDRFTGSMVFEAKCPNGVSRVPPHLDLLLEHGGGRVGVESKCVEYLRAKQQVVAEAYLRLRTRGDPRADSRWFAALDHVRGFFQLDAYQLIKHFLGLALTYPDQPLTLVYLYWEPSNPTNESFTNHRDELVRFADLVAGDRRCRFEHLSYSQHWNELDALSDKPQWLDGHLQQLRLRYEVEV